MATEKKEPLHRMAERYLRNLIDQPNYAAGALLPDEVTMAEELNISRNTLRQAISRLVNEGIIERRPGVGTRIKRQRYRGKAKAWISFTREMQDAGLKPAVFETRIGTEKPPQYVADFLQVSPDTRLTCLRRLRGVDDKPFVWFRSYFAPDVPVSPSHDFSKPLFEALAKVTNRRPELSDEEIKAVACPSDIAAMLEVEAGSPVLYRLRRVFDQNDEPLEINEGYYLSEHYTYSVKYELND